MADNQKTDWRGSQNNDLDRLLDAALAKYAAVEPRPGLDERVLARIRAERKPAVHQAWWRWGLAGALAAVVIVAAALAWRSHTPQKPVIANHPAVTQPMPRREPQIAKSGMETTPVRVPSVRKRARLPNLPTVAANPKLDQFPSRRPLTEQEKMALDYVRAYPEEAGLVARVQTNLARQEELEKLQRAAESPSFENQE